MMKAYMTEEEIRNEADSRWFKLTDGRIDMESVTPFDITYTRESVLEDTRKSAERANTIDRRTQEMLQDAIENNSTFKALVSAAKAPSFRISEARMTIKRGARSYAEAHRDDDIEVSAAELFAKSAVEYLKMIAR